jgi:hypothetical protein
MYPCSSGLFTVHTILIYKVKPINDWCSLIFTLNFMAASLMNLRRVKG